MLRHVANLAALIGLAALGLAVGDFASHPNGLGAVGLVVLVMLLGLALAWLYRPGGVASWRPAPPRDDPPPERAPEPPRRRPSQRPTSASLFDDDR